MKFVDPKSVRGIWLVGIVVAGASITAHAQTPFPEAIWQTFPEEFAFRMTGGGSPSFLGVGVAEIDSNRARELKLKEEHGVEITRIEDSSAAAKAGLKVGDVVLEYNGQRVEGMEQFTRLVRETPGGREVKLLVSRSGSVQTVPVVMGKRKPDEVLLGRSGEFFEMPRLTLPEMPRVFSMTSSSVLGIEAEGLNPQLAEFFGVKEGVLVRSVLKDSAAEKAGIKAGDVLTKVDGNAVTSPGEVTSFVHSAHSTKSFAVELVRDHRPLTLTVTMPESYGDEGVPRRRARAVKM